VPTDSFYLLAADTVLITHALFVVFAVGGALAIYIGYWLSWAWVRNYWFRLLHLGAIAFVVFESWLSIICPLTIWEMQLREKGNGSTYEGSFIQHWLHSALYYEAPEWLFIVIYTLFGGLVVASWFIVPPKRHG
jgi:polyferredoxin